MTDKIGEKHNALGIELADRGWNDEAILEFEKAIQTDKRYAPAYDNLANIYAEKGELLKALKTFMTALELDPEDPTIHYNFGCFLSNYANDLACKEYSEATRQQPNFPEAHLNLGIQFSNLGKSEEAVSELEIAVAQAPNNAEVSYELGLLLLKTNKPAKAISMFRQATRLDPQLQPAFLQLGTCYLERGFFSEAKTALTQAKKLSQDDPAVLSKLQELKKILKK